MIFYESEAEKTTWCWEASPGPCAGPLETGEPCRMEHSQPRWKLWGVSSPLVCLNVLFDVDLMIPLAIRFDTD